MKKALIFTVMLVSVLVLSFSQQTEWKVNNLTTWIEAVNGIRSGGNDKEHIINITGNISVPMSSENTFGSLTGIKVTLEGKGTISISSNGALLRIGYMQIVIVKDLTLKGRDANNSSVVEIGGTFRMEGKAMITGNSNGGVYLYGGAFIMQDNTSVSGNTTKRVGGGVYVGGGTFTMQNNASVSRNTSSFIGANWENFGGGGVYVGRGTFTMQDKASVSGNTAVNGGGVCVYSGTFTMQDSAFVSGNTANDGGGVYVYSGTFIMRDNASVSGNTAQNGGGVSNYRIFTMRDNTSVSGNTARKSGGGVYNGGAFTKTGGTIYGYDTAGDLKNNAQKGCAVYNKENGNWRNISAGLTMNSDGYGFWLNDEKVIEFPSDFTGTWKRDNFNNTLSITANTVKSNSQNFTWNISDISGDSHKLIANNTAKTALTLTIKLVNGNIVISGDSGSGQDNWNGTWKKQ